MNPAALAAALFAAREQCLNFLPLEADGKALTLNQAYLVQDAFNELQAQGDLGPVAGYKVGLTSLAMQDFCGVNEPITGVIHASGIHHSGAMIPKAGFCRLGIESEIALRLKSNLPVLTGDETMQELRECVESVHAAFEIIEDRNADYAHLDAASILAENGWNMGIVVSNGVATDKLGDLSTINAWLRVNGADAGHGVSAAVLGNPLHVLRWLAGFLARRGQMLQARQWIMTGSLLPTRFPASGDLFRFELEGVGSVELKIG